MSRDDDAVVGEISLVDREVGVNGWLACES